MFFNDNLLFCNLIEHNWSFFQSSLKLNFVHDGIVLCLSHLFASLKFLQQSNFNVVWRKSYLLVARFLTGVMHVQLDNTTKQNLRETIKFKKL